MFKSKLCPRGLRSLIAAYRQRIVAILAIVAGALIVPFSIAPALATTGDLTCTAVFQINFSPALTVANTTSKASAVVGLSNCVSLNGRFSGLKAATMTGSGPATSGLGAPCSLLVTIPFKFHIDWSNGQHSDLSATVNSNPLAGSIGFNGVVTGGVLSGDNVNALGPVVPNVDCLLNGLTSLIGANQKVFS